MNQNKLIGLVKKAILDWDDAYDCSEFRVSLGEFQRFAELVRADALDEAMQVLEFHGFDDAVPYVKWAAVNGREKK